MSILRRMLLRLLVQEHADCLLILSDLTEMAVAVDVDNSEAHERLSK